MSTNIATILVGLGYDLSALERGSPEAFRLINQQTLGMSAEMKRTSREGAEAWRLIDEALGIHVSRPLTRIVTQEFPGFAKALQGLLGAGVFGALAVAGAEAFERISKSIEKAQKAQEQLATATENVNKVFTEELTKYQHKNKAITEEIVAVDKLAEAMQKQAAAVAEAASPWTKFLATIGDALHGATSLPSTLGVEAIQKSFEEFRKRFDELSHHDALKGTHEGAKLLSDEIGKARQSLQAMQGMKLTGLDQTLNILALMTQHGDLAKIGFSQKEIDAQQAYLTNLQKLMEVLKSTESGVHNEEARAKALERQKEAAAALADLYKSMGESLKKLAPETDPLKKLAEEIRLMKQHAEADFRELGRTSDSALALHAAHAALQSYETRLDRIMANAKALAAVLEAQKNLPTTIAPSAAPQFATPNILPTLGAGGTAAAQFDAFQKDKTAQLRLAAQAYRDLITPEQQYTIAERELGLLLKEHLIDQAAYAAALQKAREEMARSADQLEKLLAKTDSAAAGVKAFFMQLEMSGGKTGSGAFAFDFLNKSLQGFEDNTVHAITEGKASWRQYFLELEQMALKFALNKEIGTLLKGLANTSIGKSLGLDLLGGANPGQVANTVALTSNTAALVANTAALALSGAASAANGASGLGAFLAGSIPMFAGGTNFAPGGMAWVGDGGEPELLNLPQGASVTPMSQMRGGGGGMPPVHVHIDARGAQMGVAEQIARSWEINGPAMVTRAVVEAFESTRRSIKNS
jgi:hypothetical protein